jgi:hypothetical protein
MLASVLLIIVGLTMGASYGWTTASFLAPITIGLTLLPTFFWWESRQEADIALLPTSIWRIPNMTTLIVFALVILGWWAVNFIPFIVCTLDLYLWLKADRSGTICLCSRRTDFDCRSSHSARRRCSCRHICHTAVSAIMYLG